jgi:SpoVK/Ycf46/Vps4 family AAA+-type ATPase
VTGPHNVDDTDARARRLLEQGLEHSRANRTAEARKSLLDAAELLARAAASTTGALRQRRLAQADDALALARRLPADQKVSPVAPVGPPIKIGPKPPLTPLPPSPTKREPVPADDEDSAADWLVTERPKVRFSDVAGLDEVKEQIRMKLIYPFEHPEAAERYGIGKGGGILLYGPPGTGKTLIARAVAGEIDAAFFAVKPSDIIKKWVGEAEKNVEKLFAAARAQPRAVVFVDEIEALAPRRGEHGSTIMNRVVTQLLQELQGFDQSSTNALLVMGATNVPWEIDPAMLRPGRFDELIYVPLPEALARRALVEHSLKDRPLAPEVNAELLAEHMEGYSGADIASICRKACEVAFKDATRTGIARDVSLDDFAVVLAQVKPSVTASEMKKYERYRLTGEAP